MKLDNIDAAILSSRSMPAPARSNSPSGSGSRARRSPDGRRYWRKKVSSVAIRPFWIWRASAFPPPFWSGSPWSQNEEALKSFEAAVIDCPSVVRCFLMSGSDDYIVIVLARDIEDFERIHRTELSRLPRVARIQSSFAMREVVNRAVPPVIFGESRRPRSGHPAR